VRVQAIESPGLRECTAGGSGRVLCASTIKGLVCGYEVEGLGILGRCRELYTAKGRKVRISCACLGLFVFR